MKDSPPRIYAIADASTLGPHRLARSVGEMARAGIRWIQVRAKAVPDDELYRRAEECHAAVEGTGAVLWMNDRVDLAALFPFFGVHLGRTDLSPPAARLVLGAGRWIGSSTHDGEQVREADADPDVDLVAYGPVFGTASKKSPDPEVGIEGLRAVRALTAKPLVAIGGIGAATLGRVLEAGADSVAMIGAICIGDIGANCRRLLRAARAEARA